MIRLLDVLLSTIALIIFLPLVVVIWFSLLISGHRPFFSQYRVGLDGIEFRMWKFRTMRHGTQEALTHQIPHEQITGIGKLLRTYHLDEIPQLLNVILGDMSLVGPRPGLKSDIYLTSLRTRKGILQYRPGITGMAQIMDISMSDPDSLVHYDSLMLKHWGLAQYTKILLKTFGYWIRK